VLPNGFYVESVLQRGILGAEQVAHAAAVIIGSRRDAERGGLEGVAGGMRYRSR
jgi:hypothetical protein